MRELVSDVLVELCAGSAAVSLAALGSTRHLLPYMGAKWRYRREILAALDVQGPPDRVVLVDPGPWGSTWGALGERLPDVLEIVRQYAAEEDHGETWSRLRSLRVPTDPVSHAADHLTLQRLAFRGKPVEARGGRWQHPGLSKTCAYGKPATPRFDEVKRQLPGLVRKLESLARVQRPIEAHQRSAADIEPISGACVYIDPPYVGVTGYGSDLPRTDVLAIAQRWADAGCTVVVSEAEPLDLPGWRHVRLDDPTPRMGRKRQEWITCWTAEEPS